MANPKTLGNIGALGTSSVGGTTSANGPSPADTGKACSLIALMEASRTLREIYNGSPQESIAGSLGEQWRRESRLIRENRVLSESCPTPTSPFKHRFLGFDVVVSPLLDELTEPNVKVKQIFLSDGTPLLSLEFIARENEAWKELHGAHSVAYFIDGKALAIGQQMKEAIDRHIVKAIFGPESS